MEFFSAFFFFKQKTAYEMRISDWSSDVCSSDLDAGDRRAHHRIFQVDARQIARGDRLRKGRDGGLALRAQKLDTLALGIAGSGRDGEIGRAPCRERVCKSVEISGVAVTLKKKKSRMESMSQNAMYKHKRRMRHGKHTK